MLDDEHLNSLGADETALSKSFFEKQSTKEGARNTCRKHLNTVMRKWGAKTDNRLFTCFKSDKACYWGMDDTTELATFQLSCYK